MSSVTDSPPRAPPILYKARLGTRWQKEKEAAGDKALEFPDDPKLIGPWIIGECVGKGASGHVKIARHRHTGQLAAVKILPLQPIFNSRSSLATQKARSDKQRLGIDREITMMKLMNHPNIMRIYDVYEGDAELYLVLEYIEGGELFDFLVNRGKLVPLEALAYFKQIVYGLNYAHSFSIIHRDLKPENILIHSIHPPLLKIADWGMAAFAPPAWHLETSCGSPHYASPEIVNGHKYQGTATDIWSCGVILFALLTGRLPFDDKNVRNLLGKVKLGKYEIPPFVDLQAKDLISRMLVVDVTKRITMAEILDHPWLKKATPSVLYVPAPSVEELARPLPSKAHIDRDLFESLCVIWGRHVDFNSIKDDLLSPPGQGTLAKAFYFLLQKHREKTLEGHGIVMDDDGPSGDKVVLKQYIAPRPRESLKLDLGGSSALSRQHNERFGCRTPVPTVSGADNPSPSRFRPSSPAGPRAQKSRPMSSPITPLLLPMKDKRSSQVISAKCRQAVRVSTPSPTMQDYSHHLAHVRRPAQSGIRHTSPSPVYPASTFLGHTPAHPPAPAMARAATEPRPGPSSIPTPTPRTSMTPVNATHFYPAPRVPVQLGRKSLISQPMARSRATAPHTIQQPDSTAVHAPVPTHAYTPAILPMITAPRVASSDVQRTIDEIADRMNLLVAHENAYYASSHSYTPTIPTSSDPDQSKDDSDLIVDNDKENNGKNSSGKPASRSHVIQGGLGFGTSVPLSKEMANVLYTKAPIAGETAKEKKEWKHKPPALDLHSSSKRQNINSPLLSPSGIPVAGEFKGWFSNLFNWRAQSYVLYSLEDLIATRDELTRLLSHFGITFMATESPMTSIVKCRLDDVHDELSGTVLQKQVRFRVEFSILGGGDSSTSFRLITPKLAQHPMTPTLNTSAFASAAVLILEKGAVSTFKSAYFKLRESWRLDMAPPQTGNVYTAQGSSIGLAV